ncbi:hypothetical protein FHX82_002722 [Amycolatopsis bartoniae]|uniref:Uncharacterized protein n=1 Tax=Amycolatopsis bartoniae TaxID=941986 RepID=A0A8H9IWA5_9PSEU|nr:hypothetical protein [Amycolatopsis bartoniae]MBB2935668.1 hypothetical protein [Amycolatopsis bartoniae]TVT02320.1 hypothetical protein FNH07_27595 [Amycolatopsis bartoniae]GHF60978.1 hypothetical protein GCM10017566_37960 [Amycolatopsis bartoniae]
MRWENLRTQIDPRTDDLSSLPATFVIKGNSADTYFFEFSSSGDAFQFEAIEHRVELQVKLGHRDGWRSAGFFSLWMQHVHSPEIYAAYRNESASCAEAELPLAHNALKNIYGN